MASLSVKRSAHAILAWILRVLEPNLLKAALVLGILFVRFLTAPVSYTFWGDAGCECSSQQEALPGLTIADVCVAGSRSCVSEIRTNKIPLMAWLAGIYFVAGIVAELATKRIFPGRLLCDLIVIIGVILIVSAPPAAYISKRMWGYYFFRPPLPTELFELGEPIRFQFLSSEPNSPTLHFDYAGSLKKFAWYVDW